MAMSPTECPERAFFDVAIGNSASRRITVRFSCFCLSTQILNLAS
jgi:cyclophilin family peptidyl-prolyl cis-trans isomerase